MAHDQQFIDVLYALRIVGFCEVQVLHSRLGGDSVIAASQIEQRLREAETAELATFRNGRMSGWTLTVAGREVAQQAIHAERDVQQAAGAMMSAYESFLPINAKFLELCSDWQLFDGAASERQMNDHSDEEYDATVLSRLATIDREVAGIVGSISGQLSRFSRYGDRFRHAHSLVQGGEIDWFTRPTLDSYHTVWFELHEDLLTTLGRHRSDERAKSPG